MESNVCIYEDLNAFKHKLTRKTYVNAAALETNKTTVKGREPFHFLPVTAYDLDRSGEYNLVLHGVLTCGSKACVVVKGITPYVMVRVPAPHTVDQFRGVVEEIVEKQVHSAVVNYETRQLRPFHGYTTEKANYIAYYFKTLYARKMFIEQLAKYNKNQFSHGRPLLELAHDATSTNEYCVLAMCEYRFELVAWNLVENYSAPKGEKIRGCYVTVEVDASGIRGNDLGRRAGEPLIAHWDIETHREIQNGIIPTEDDRDFTIFMLCTSYYWMSSVRPIVSVCCVIGDPTPRPDFFVVSCKSEEEAITAHLTILGLMRPDILTAFNGGNFDWPLLRAKISVYGLEAYAMECLKSVPESKYSRKTVGELFSYMFGRTRVKISAEEFQQVKCVLNVAGILDIDTMVLFMKLYPRYEGRGGNSLKYFLETLELAGKEDMPYKRLFKIYERSRKLSAVHSCHCGNECPLCAEIVRDIDCLPGGPALDGEPTYTQSLHHDIAGLCCYCGKRERNRRDMSEVAYYCYIDCHRLQELWIKKMVGVEFQQIAYMSRTNLQQAYYRGGGFKVMGLMRDVASQMGLPFGDVRYERDFRSKEKIHYPGAYIFMPNRGLHSDEVRDMIKYNEDGSCVVERGRAGPVIGLDFTSLYPSTILAHNYSPDMVVTDPAEAAELEKKGYSLQHVKKFKYEVGEKKNHKSNRWYEAEGWVVKHNGIIDPDKDTRVVTKYEYRNSYTYTVRATGARKTVYGSVPEEDAGDWAADSYREESYSCLPAEYGREALPGEHMGIAGRVIHRVFHTRIAKKKRFETLQEMLEEINVSKAETVIGLIDGAARTYTREDLIHDFHITRAQQLALKILMNTVYGTLGSEIHWVFSLICAAGVTMSGQDVVREAAKYVQGAHGCYVQYGDTDSIYVTFPEQVYAACSEVYWLEVAAIDAKYKGVAKVDKPASGPETEYKTERIDARVKWWTEKIRVTMGLSDALQRDINAHFARITNTNCFAMNYEGVDYAVLFCGKKKYAMLSHKKKANFNSRPEIKGLGPVRRETAPCVADATLRIINTLVSPRNEAAVLDVVREVLHEYATAADPDKFAMAATYKPHKQNIAVNRFAERMKDAYGSCADSRTKAFYEPPEPGDKFKYVVVTPENVFDPVTGRRLEISKGDKMMYLRLFKYLQSIGQAPEIDKEHYAELMAGAIGRLIANLPEFQPQGYNISDLVDGDVFTEYDGKSWNAAKKYVASLCVSKDLHEQEILTGRKYRHIFSFAVKHISYHISQALGLPGDLVVSVCRAANMREEVLKLAADKGMQRAAEGAGTAHKLMLAEGVEDNYFSQGGPLMVKKRIAEEMEQKLRGRINLVIDDYVRVLSEFVVIRNRFINAARDMTDPEIAAAAPGVVDHLIANKELLSSFYYLWIEFCAVIGTKQTYIAIYQLGKK